MTAPPPDLDCGPCPTELTGIAHVPAAICATCGAPVVDVARLCSRCSPLHLVVDE